MSDKALGIGLVVILILIGTTACTALKQGDGEANVQGIFAATQPISQPIQSRNEALRVFQDYVDQYPSLSIPKCPEYIPASECEEPIVLELPSVNLWAIVVRVEAHKGLPQYIPEPGPGRGSIVLYADANTAEVVPILSKIVDPVVFQCTEGVPGCLGFKIIVNTTEASHDWEDFLQRQHGLNKVAAWRSIPEAWQMPPEELKVIVNYPWINAIYAGPMYRPGEILVPRVQGREEEIENFLQRKQLQFEQYDSLYYRVFVPPGEEKKYIQILESENALLKGSSLNLIPRMTGGTGPIFKLPERSRPHLQQSFTKGTIITTKKALLSLILLSLIALVYALYIHYRSKRALGG